MTKNNVDNSLPSWLRDDAGNDMCTYDLETKNFGSPKSTVTSKKDEKERLKSFQKNQGPKPKVLQIGETEILQKQATDYRLSFCANSVVRVLQFVVSILYFLLGVETFELHFAARNISYIIVAVYMVIFGSILFLYELSRIIPLNMISNLMRGNFGFLYGLLGKGLYVLFITFLAFSVESEYNIYIGGIMAFDAALLLTLHLKYRKDINAAINDENTVSCDDEEAQV